MLIYPYDYDSYITTGWTAGFPTVPVMPDILIELNTAEGQQQDGQTK